MRLLALVAVAAALLVPPAAAQLSYFPWHFIKDGKFTGLIVVGAEGSSQDVLAASDIAVYIQSKLKGDRLAGDTKLDLQVASVKQSLIAVGDPCRNTVAAQILGIEGPCTSFFPEGEGYLILKEYPDYVHLVVTGGTPKDTARAATVLGKHANYKTKDYINLVTGDAEPYAITSLSDKEFAAKFPAVDISGTGPEDGDGEGGDGGDGGDAGSGTGGQPSNESGGSPTGTETTAPPNGTGPAPNATPNQTGASPDERPEEKKPNFIVRFFRWVFGLFKRK